MAARCCTVLLVFLCWRVLGSVCVAEIKQDVCSSLDHTCDWVHWKNAKALVNGTLGREPHIYCLQSVKGVWLRLKNVWTQYEVSLAAPKGSNLTLQPGNSSDGVRLASQETTWAGLWVEPRGESILRVDFSPFESGCVGVASLKDNKVYEYQLVFKQVLSKLCLLLLMAGVLLFMNAPRLCRNVAFYYAGGITIGVMASVLVLLYVFSKVIPKKNLFGLGMVIGGWSLTGYFITWFLTQGWGFMLQNWFYISAYITVAALVTSAFLYRIGPAHNRTLQLLQWSTQLLALSMVYWSFQAWEVSLAAMTMLLVWYSMPAAVFSSLASIFCCIFFCFRPFRRLFWRKARKKLLTAAEYENQGRVETESALKELQEYCQHSRKFWKHKLNKLEDKQQFMNFLSGQDHVSEEERDEHWREFAFALNTSSEEDSDSESGSFLPDTQHSFHSTSTSPPSPTLSLSPSPLRQPYRHPHNASPRSRFL